MRHIRAEEVISIPDGVSVKINARKVVVEGKYGRNEREFKHMPVEVTVDEEKKQIRAVIWLAKPVQKSVIRTFCSHVENMIKGVTEKYQYKLRLVYNHFPININLAENGTVVEIRNFLGERRTRVVKMLPGVTCVKSTNVKDELVLEGIDVENVSHSAALLHQSALVRNKDIRQFLDGIYVSSKGTIEAEA